jgi:hypothetical protein
VVVPVVEAIAKHMAPYLFDGAAEIQKQAAIA